MSARLCKRLHDSAWLKRQYVAKRLTMQQIADKIGCTRQAVSDVRLQLFALAYNLGNFLRRLVLPRPMKTWTMTTLREKLIKIGAKMVRHARYVTFQLAEVAIPRGLYRAILRRIRRFAAIVPRAAPI